MPLSHSSYQEPDHLIVNHNIKTVLLFRKPSLVYTHL